MIKEFDYSHDIDEGVAAKEIRMSFHVSLVSSYRQNTMSSHRRVLMDLDHYIQESKNQEDLRMKDLKNRQKHIGQEITKQQAHKEFKRKQLQEEIKKKKLQQCTFKPKTNPSKTSARNFNDFLKNQSAHTQKVNKKRQLLRKNIEQKKQKVTYQPKVNSRRKQSCQSSKNMQNSVHNRLYALKDKQPKEQIDQFTFHPNINQRSKNLIRDVPVQQLLYQQALRRQERQNSEIQEYSKQKNKSVNLNNQKYAAQKFIKELFFALEELQIETRFQNTIDYLMFGELLKKLGFISNEEESQSQSYSIERSLLHSAYEFLEEKRVNARNTCVFLLAIIGIYHINPINFDEGEEIEEEKQLNLSEGQGRKLQKHFELFYRNRLSSQDSRKQECKTQQYSFQPQINSQSQLMAEKHRNVMLEEANQLITEYPQLELIIPEDGVISHTDLLVLHKMAKDLQKEKMRQERDCEEMKQCTFKPQTLPSSMNCSKISITKSGSKHLELYEYHKQLRSKKDSMKVSRQEQMDPECTFKPQINRQKPPKHPLVPPSKQTDETLYRMFKGREQSEKKKQFLERGEKLKNSFTQKEEEKVPTLILDVNLGENIDRITLYPGDEERLEEIADQFASKHDLDEQSTCKLLEMLQVELQNVLEKIEEDEESEEAEY